MDISERIKVINNQTHLECVMCGKASKGKMFWYKHQKFVPDHNPEALHPMCKRCVYKEELGSKLLYKKMKGGSLG